MRRILVVEDERASAEALTDFLTMSGYDVRCAAEGVAALESGRAFSPDVLVSDWLLSGERDGVAVARELSAEHPNMKVVFLTGFPASHLASRIEGLPVFRVLTKPVSLYEIREVVRAALAHGA